MFATLLLIKDNILSTFFIGLFTAVARYLSAAAFEIFIVREIDKIPDARKRGDEDDDDETLAKVGRSRASRFLIESVRRRAKAKLPRKIRFDDSRSPEMGGRGVISCEIESTSDFISILIYFSLFALGQMWKGKLARQWRFNFRTKRSKIFIWNRNVMLRMGKKIEELRK